MKAMRKGSALARSVGSLALRTALVCIGDGTIPLARTAPRMSDWQERITPETAPSIRIEHELRYRVAAPLILSADTWADLGCGNGIAAAIALGDERPANAVLVDLHEAALERAARELSMPAAAQIAGNLADVQVLQAVGDALLAHGQERVVTCFEVVEHLPAFLPLIQWSHQMALEHRVTFVLSVPNDAFWSIENPHHVSAWSEGAFEELRRMLPAEQTLLRQVSLTGSAIIDWDAASAERGVGVSAGGAEAVATHFLVAFGPRHDEVIEGVLAVQTNQLEQRRWERQREANLALAEELNRDQKTKLRAQHEQLKANVTTFEEWREYIHQLEHELGRPPSGRQASDEAEDASGAQDEDPGAPADPEHREPRT
jgi:SAM-dependent methyltransferase